MIIVLLLVLSACHGGTEGSQAEQLALEVRGSYLALTGCTGSMQVTADYGQRVYQYTMELSWTEEGETVLTLTAPQEVAGITVHLEQEESVLEYDGVRVETGALDSQGLNPLEAVPLLLKTTREGFLAECLLEDWDGVQTLHVTSRDPNQEPGQGREVQIWFDAKTGALLRGEVSQDGYTIVRCEFTSFVMSGA